jgi:dTDP-4-dehydrorhamnose 3,5-epimerase
MEFFKTHLDGLLVIEPRVFEDSRGFFFESFNHKKFEEYVPNIQFFQDNHSKSNKGVLRGLHYQIQHTQGKLVRVVQGSVFDVAVDIRKSSPTFGQWFGIELSGSNKKQLWIPTGFAHGFLTLEDNTEFLYKTTDFYHPDFERSILWNDSEIGISWPSNFEVKLSVKDQVASKLKNAEVYL